jgi:cell wall-associated NlpC family hydrolase
VSVSENAERAAALLERLLSDPVYRSAFRADPARACAEEGLPEVAAELGRGRAMQTLEIRESRSSLAGVLMAAALEGASLAVLVDHAEAAGAVDPTAASALAQLTQSQQAVPPPPAVDPTAPIDGTPPVALDPTTAAAPSAPVDVTAAPTPVDPTTATPPPVVDPPAPVNPSAPVDPPAPAVDVIGGPAPAANGPSVQFLPAVTQTDPTSLPATTPVEPLSTPVEAPAVPAAPAAPVTGVLQQVVQQQPAAIQAPATVGALPAVPAVADHVDALAVASGGPNPYPGDNAGQAAIAAWMARDAQAAGLPPELPVMASLVESGLTNLPGGDRDSMGFFQMRAGIWDRGAYAGFSQNPELQMKWFIDHALAIKAKRIAEGDATYGQDPSGYGNWVADIEVPYEPYRGRYQLRLGDAQSLLANVSTAPPAAAATAPVADAAAAASTPIPAADVAGPVIDIAPGVPVMDAQAASPTALAAIKVAAQYLGTSYHFGGASPETGFDCSGLMQWSYSHAGVSIPRVTYDQIDVGVPVDRAHLVPGDLVFFQHDGDVHHVGMYLGGGRFLQAPHTGDVVKVSSLDEPYYAEQFAGGRRMA